MNSFLTQYGELKKISLYNSYPGKQLKECIVNERTTLFTPIGPLIPQKR